MGDCLEIMKQIPTGSIDLVLTDPPYGTTKCKWDSVIPFDKMWDQLRRIRKENGAILLFGSEPFSSTLRLSNVKEFKYDWIYVKNKGGNFFNAKYQPLVEHETISTFYKKLPVYNPIMQRRADSGFARQKTPITRGLTKNDGIFGKSKVQRSMVTEKRFPSNVQKFNVERGLHPTQKPVALLEYLIKTYTLEGETVLDFTMGSGSTGVACKNLNRKFIGIEQDEKYYQIAVGRCEGADNE